MQRPACPLALALSLVASSWSMVAGQTAFHLNLVGLSLQGGIYEVGLGKQSAKWKGRKEGLLPMDTDHCALL